MQGRVGFAHHFKHRVELERFGGDEVAQTVLEPLHTIRHGTHLSVKYGGVLAGRVRRSRWTRSATRTQQRRVVPDRPTRLRRLVPFRPNCKHRSVRTDRRGGAGEIHLPLASGVWCDLDGDDPDTGSVLRRRQPKLGG